MRVRIDTIIVKKRIRKDLREIDSLMESMKKFGQLSPIIINRNNELLAGERRLTAALKLGWNTIDALVLDREEEIEMLEIELEENIARNNLTNDEIADGYQKLDKLRHPNIFRRIINFFKRLFKRLFGRKKKF